MKQRTVLLILQLCFHSTARGAPEKLTQEQVLEELGVKIETKEWTYSVAGVEGSLVELPCNASTALIDDDVKLVLWFKNGSNKPIYTYDNRDGSQSHWSDEAVLSGRALFLAKYNPARLTLESIRYEDNSVYKCRVDFKKAPTSVSIITLQVIVPPETPTIFVRKKAILEDLGIPDEDEAVVPSKHEMPLSRVNKNTTPNDVLPAAAIGDWKQDYIVVNVLPTFNGRVINQSSSYPVTDIGPYTLGETVKLRCLSTRGRPSPNVTWWRDNAVLIDESFESHDDVVINDLEVHNLQRQHRDSILSCKAVNNILSPPAIASVKILMHYGPSVVKLMLRSKTLSAGKSHQIKCEAIGAKPQATITWWVGGKQINNFVSSALIGDGNATISTLTYSAKPEDHGALLACQAHVEGLAGSTVEDSRRLHVQYAPRAELRLGRSLNASNIKEGDDVYFECLIQSNPPPSKIVWTRNAQELSYSIERGVIISNQSLVLQKVTKVESGLYQCIATNAEGQGNSNTVHLPIKYKPFCRDDQQDVYGVATGETVRIPCDVIADPNERVQFEWVFNTSTEWYPKQAENAFGVTSKDRGWTRAYIEHTPKSEMDFGSIMCWATNEIGRQAKPCIFHLLPAGKPEPVSNCSVASSSYSTMRIVCEPGFNGGLKQTFTMEIRESEPSRKTSGGLVGNLTGRVRPDFMLTGLIPDTGYMISVFAVNLKGRSDRMTLQAYTHKSDQLFETNESALTNMDGFQITPVFGILLTLGSAMAVVFLAISAFFCLRRRPLPPSNPPASNNEQRPQTSTYSVGYSVAGNVAISNESALAGKSNQAEMELKTMENPDVVPRGKRKGCDPSFLMAECAIIDAEGAGGFEVQGDKTKFATLQRQRKQLYDELRDSKCRAQAMKKNHNQFEGSSEKLLMNEFDGASYSPQHFIPELARYGPGPFSTSSGRASPCSTPTPPPYSRNRIIVSPSVPSQQQQWSPRSPNSMMTRVKRDQQQGKPAKFITYSCQPDDLHSGIAEESLEEASVASSRESRV